MKTYARVQRGLVVEIIAPMAYDAEAPDWNDGDLSRIGQDIPIELRYTPDLVAMMFDISEISPPPQFGWTFDGTTFAAPEPYQPSPDELKASALAQRDALLAAANQATAGMSDAYIIGLLNADDTATFKAYAAYKLALGKIDTQAGYPQTIKWPVAPT